MKIGTVLCPVDLSPLADRIVALASSVCACFGARLVIEHNLDTAPPASFGVSWMWSRDHRGATADHDADAQRRIRECLETVPAGIPREARLTRGPLDAALLHLARALPADLILMGSHGWGSAHHRSLTERIIRISSCSVLAADENTVHDFSFLCAPAGGEAGAREARIVVPVDFSPGSFAVASMAAQIARKRPVGIDLLCPDRTGSDNRGMARLKESMDRLPAAADRITVRYHTMSWDPLEGIVEFCRRTSAALVMIPTRAGALAALRGGGLPRALLHMSPAPVWFVPTAVWRRAASRAA